jgi:hypothetical protein
MRRTVVVMLVVAIALDAAYWSTWFTQRDWLASEHTQGYYDFEDAFPLADLWLGTACVLALVNLVRRRASALLWLIATGAAGLYLGCMDLLYDLEHGIFGKGWRGSVRGRDRRGHLGLRDHRAPIRLDPSRRPARLRLTSRTT